VRTVHATLGRRLFVLLNGHVGLRKPGSKPVGLSDHTVASLFTLSKVG
jgi:hypothetical protein